MPIYEYRCQACGFEKEFLQKLSDAPITDCPSCGQSAMSKLISAAGFQLKGTGWYATDFKNSGSKPAKHDSQKSGSDGEKKGSDGEKKEDTKSEAAPTCGAGACPACQ
jgi:putative FmdB family regulatory protein